MTLRGHPFWSPNRATSRGTNNCPSCTCTWILQDLVASAEPFLDVATMTCRCGSRVVHPSSSSTSASITAGEVNNNRSSSILSLVLGVIIVPGLLPWRTSCSLLWSPRHGYRQRKLSISVRLFQHGPTFARSLTSSVIESWYWRD